MTDGLAGLTASGAYISLGGTQTEAPVPDMPKAAKRSPTSTHPHTSLAAASAWHEA